MSVVVPATVVAPARGRALWRRPLLVLLLAALVGRTVFTIWEPPFDGTLRYDEIAPLGGAYWPMNLYLGGPAHLVSFVVTAVAVIALARGRTAALNLAAAALIGLGGTVFSLVITAEVLPFAYAADPAVMSEAEGRALFDVLNGHLGWLVPAILGGMLAVVAGVLLALLAGWLSGMLPRWFVIAGVLFVVAFLALPTDALPRPAALAFYLAEMTLLGLLGWFGLRHDRHDGAAGTAKPTSG